jgi:hypothetical protein
MIDAATALGRPPSGLQRFASGLLVVNAEHSLETGIVEGFDDGPGSAGPGGVPVA